MTKADPRFFFPLKGGGGEGATNFNLENVLTSRKLNKYMNNLSSLFNHGVGLRLGTGFRTSQPDR